MKEILIAALIILIAGCITQQLPHQTGTLTGHISIGPLCPVERNPPDPRCEPTEKTYQAYSLNVYSSHGTKVTNFRGDANGDYSVNLLAGTYTVKQETGIEKFSRTVEIQAGKTTRLDIGIDTGIR